MAFEGQQRIVAVHPCAVVRDTDQPPPTALNLDPDAGCAGVERILQQLLDHRSRTVHDFARGDLVSHQVREYSDAPHKELG